MPTRSNNLTKSHPPRPSDIGSEFIVIEAAADERGVVQPGTTGYLRDMEGELCHVYFHSRSYRHSKGEIDYINASKIVIPEK